MQINDVAIIGAGPSGIATALQLKRYRISPLVYEKERIGGLLWNANLVENYLGFPDGISGPELVQLFIEQMNKYGIEVRDERVVEIVSQGNLFNIITEKNATCARILVIASGTRPNQFPQDFIPPEVYSKVFYEVVTLLENKNGHVVIVGAGDAAFDYGLNLAKNNHVTILNKDAEVKCLPLLLERCLASPAITYCKQTIITSISKSSGDDIELECTQPSGKINLHTDFLLGALGRKPQLDFLPPALQPDALSLAGQGRLFFVGDVKNGNFRQTAIAIGDGIQAAMKIYFRLKESRT